MKSVTALIQITLIFLFHVDKIGLWRSKKKKIMVVESREGSNKTENGLNKTNCHLDLSKNLLLDDAKTQHEANVQVM